MILERAAQRRDRLARKLCRRRERFLQLLSWYTGEQDPPGLPREHTGDLYKRIRDTSRSSWGRLIVDAIAERLEVQGYHSSNADQTVDADAWAMLQANRIDADQRQVHTEALLGGTSYVMVSGEPEQPMITPETPLEVTHAWVPGTRRIVRDALKVFEVDEGLWRAELYTPDFVFVWHADRSRSDTGELWQTIGAGPGQNASVWDEEEVEQGANELGIVTLVPFENRPLPSTGPLSELHDLVNVFARIDELTCDRQIAGHFAAFRQRWASGLEIPRDPTTGEPIEPFHAAVSKLWISEDPDSKFGTFEATDLDQYTKAKDSEVAELAAISRVPSHYLMQQNLANPPSAETLIASESGLVQKVRDRQRGYGESWEQVVRIAFLLAGNDAAASDLSSQVIWRDPQVRNPAQVADAATKYATVGVPRDAIWTYLGATPQELEQWRSQSAEDELRAAAAAAAALPAPPAQ